MRLAHSIAFAPLALVFWACASRAKSDAPAPEVDAPAAESAGEPQIPDFSLERQLVEEASAAVAAVDLAAARSKAGEAIERLLARPESERNTSWLELTTAAGRAAWEARDARAARAAFQGVVDVRSRTLPDDHLDLQRARLNLASALRALGDLATARALQERVVEAFTRELPDDHPDLQRARGSLAATVSMLGDLAAARALFEKVLEVRSRTLPEDHPDLQGARGNLALMLSALGELAAARELQEKALAAFSRTLPDDHPDLQGARMNLAMTLSALGDLAAARVLEEKFLEVGARTLPEDHPDMQAARGNHAVTLWMLGDVAAARALFERVLEVNSRALRDDHPDLQAARMNLAVALRTAGEFAAARELEERVIEVYSRTLPEDHPDLQSVRANLANTLERLGDLAGARELQVEVLDARTNSLPPDHPDLQRARLNLSRTLFSLGDIAQARELQERVLEVRSRTLPPDHIELQRTLGSLACTLAIGRATGNEEETEAFTRLTESFTRAITRAARVAVLTASSREAEERCANSVADLGRAFSLAEGLGAPGLVREIFVLSEETRGAALASARLSRRASADPGYEELREAMRDASRSLARLASEGAGADELDRARSAREKAERDLAQLARELSGGESALLEFDPGRISASLSGNEALIGYRRYPRSAHEPGEGNAIETAESLCAFVLRSGDRLERVELGPIEPIERSVGELRRAIGAGRGRGVGVGPPQAGTEDAVRSEGRGLRRLVFDPLLPALDGVERIVVALDDVLNLVPLDALPLEAAGETSGPAERSLLGDRWRIETRCTLSELSWKDDVAEPGEALVAIGGAAFDLPPLSASAEDVETDDEPEAASHVVASFLRGSAWEEGFAPLGATGPEARGIAELYSGAFAAGRPALVLEKRKASRASLAELAPRARFLHVATHGWFAPESVRSIADSEPLDKLMGFGSRMSGEERARGLSPMLLCGLALAGANLAEDAVGRAPGLITAEEISTLDLSGCELAVLSACDTNVGERRAGQGVASLQKALHMAGARTVITSLWKVPDEATRELMLDFYRRIWIEKKPKGVALWEAKTRIRDAKDERGKPLYTTRDWAAWVLTGDPH